MTVRRIEPDQLDREQSGNLIISQILTVSALEAEIDRLVYKLYDLPEEEVQIVEGES
jgi:hypothetical protein